MSSTPITVQLDSDYDLSYVQLSDDAVAQTVEFTQEIQVDLDRYNMVVGIEFLTLAVDVDLDGLAARFHIHSDQVELLRSGLSALRDMHKPQVSSGRFAPHRTAGAVHAEGRTYLQPA